MKILNLHVEGFRSLKSVDWAPGDLNVVIGPNGSGKSNLLRVLELVDRVCSKGACRLDPVCRRDQAAPLGRSSRCDRIWAEDNAGRCRTRTAEVCAGVSSEARACREEPVLIASRARCCLTTIASVLGSRRNRSSSSNARNLRPRYSTKKIVHSLLPRIRSSKTRHCSRSRRGRSAGTAC